MDARAPLAGVRVLTPFGFRVLCNAEHGKRITTIQHPPRRDRLADVEGTLADPDEMRRSVNDADVLLFHRRVEPRWGLRCRPPLR